MSRRGAAGCQECAVRCSNIPHYGKRSHNSKILLRRAARAHYNPLELAAAGRDASSARSAILTFQDPGDENVRRTQ
ncbi:conserved protein of unknown function [Burkholderia multivorans]